MCEDFERMVGGMPQKDPHSTVGGGAYAILTMYG